MKKTVLLTILFLLTVAMITGCSGFKHGYTKAQARDQYLKVDAKAENFGFERVQAIIDYRGGAIDNFILEKGYPDYLYEYEKEDQEGDEREGFIFYYLEEGKAYDFMEKSWKPNSARMVEIREFTEFEKKRFGI